MGLKRLYVDIYEQFRDKYAHAKGYHFQESRSGSTTPKPVSFKEKLKWWTLNRPNRLTTIRQERDRLQQEIIELPCQQAETSSDTPPREWSVTGPNRKF